MILPYEWKKEHNSVIMNKIENKNIFQPKYTTHENPIKVFCWHINFFMHVVESNYTSKDDVDVFTLCAKWYQRKKLKIQICVGTTSSNCSLVLSCRNCGIIPLYNLYISTGSYVESLKKKWIFSLLKMMK